MTTLTNIFEGGTSGTTISTGNSGGTSGTAFDVVNIPAQATDAFDNAHAAHGGLSCKLATGATSGQVYNAWTTTMGSQAQVWWRQYLYFTANPAASQRVLQLLAGGSSAAGVLITTAGQVQVVNSAGSSVTTSTATIPLNAWFRLEGFVTGSATTGQTEVKLFTSPDSTTPAETDTSASNLNTSGTLTVYRFGHGGGSGIANLGPFWMDDIGLSSTGYIGPSLRTQALAAVSASHSAVTRSTAKTLRASPSSHGTLLKAAGKLLAAVPHPSASLARAAGKALRAASHPLGALARTARKTLAATAHPSGKLARGILKRLAGVSRPAGTLARSAGKNLAAAARSAAALGRGRTKLLAARITAAARLSLPAPSFALGLPGTEWSVSISSTGVSHLSTQYYLVPVAVTRSGAPYNPTADAVQFAFMPTATQVPQNSDWTAGAWDTNSANLIYPYSAKCLVGPSGTISLGIGTYIVYVKITDNPEIPVLIAGQLQVQ